MATVRVSGVGKNLNFEEQKKVLIQRQGSGTFVQTDKPVYTPGQRGEARVSRDRQARETACIMMESCELDSGLKGQGGGGQASLAIKCSGLIASLNSSKSVGRVAGASVCRK